MATISIYRFVDYKKFLIKKIEQEKKLSVGAKSRTAEAARCPQSYLSQVIHGKAQWRYYTNLINAAVHVALTVPSLTTVRFQCVFQ